MAKARMERKDPEGKSMTQKDLATKVNERPAVIQEYESGKASESGFSLRDASSSCPLLPASLALLSQRRRISPRAISRSSL